MKKSKVPNAQGKTTIYDFDEWSRAHYGTSFARRQAAKERYDRQEARKERNALQLKSEILLILMAATVVGFGAVFWQEYHYDTNRITKKDNKKKVES